MMRPLQYCLKARVLSHAWHQGRLCLRVDLEGLPPISDRRPIGADLQMECCHNRCLQLRLGSYRGITSWFFWHPQTESTSVVPQWEPLLLLVRVIAEARALSTIRLFTLKSLLC